MVHFPLEEIDLFYFMMDLRITKREKEPTVVSCKSTFQHVFQAIVRILRIHIVEET